jgi:hypothetical protein
VVNVLPKPGIGLGRHGLVEVNSLHALYGRHDLSATKAQCGGTSQRRAGDGKPPQANKRSLEGFEVMGWFPLLRHVPPILHLYGVKSRSSNHATTLHSTALAHLLITAAFITARPSSETA